MSKWQSEILEAIEIYSELKNKAVQENNLYYSNQYDSEIKRLNNLFVIA